MKRMVVCGEDVVGGWGEGSATLKPYYPILKKKWQLNGPIAIYLG